MSHESTQAETEIRKLIDDRVQAVRAKDVESAAAPFTPDLVAFDVIGPLRFSGLDALRGRVEEWFSSFNGPIGYEVRDIRIEASGDVAFSHSLNGVAATMTNGQKLEMWWRATICYRRIGGRWMIVHEHNSVPFDPHTGNASVGLRP